MKRIFVLVLLVASFSACKKENYVCKCTTTGPGDDTQTSVNLGSDITSESAEESCNDSEVSNSLYTTTCTVFRE